LYGIQNGKYGYPRTFMRGIHALTNDKREY
jgi:hypothetical protein